MAEPARSAARSDLPAGDVTFLFTDIEGSTRLLDSLGAEAYAEALAWHRGVLREAFARHAGVEVDTQGDAFFVAFTSAPAAAAAAREATAALASGPVRVRMGIHTGQPLLTDEGYVGPDVHRAARIAAAGHGGQVLVSRQTRDRIDGQLADLGEHRLKDIDGPVWLFQLGEGPFPPLDTISNTNLPRPTSPLVGRDTEVANIDRLLASDTRIVTLTGPGGVGKTRLAIEVGRRLVARFRSGAFLVELAPVAHAGLVEDAIRRAIGAKAGLADHIGEREMLLLLDNLEHVIEAAPQLSALVQRCPNLRLLVTSRELLRVRGEREYAVQSLAERHALALFTERSGLAPDDTVRQLCRSLDNLPLAIELAAARARVLSPAQINARLADRLDLLKGERDSDPRQRTLRAAIEWSYDLLPSTEQRLFERLSVFVGGCTIDAAEAVAEAEIDELQSLVDKSLVEYRNERFLMLETIRVYAVARLAADGVGEELMRRHAAYYLQLARKQAARLRAGEPEEGPVWEIESEIGNLRAAIEFSAAAGDHGVVREITAALPMYWLMRGRYTEAREWIERALAIDETRDELRHRLLVNLGMMAYLQGDHRAAIEATDTAAVLANELGGATDRMTSLRERGVAALNRGDYEEAEKVFSQRLEVAAALRNWVTVSSSRLSLASIANATQRHMRALALLDENLRFVRAKGQARCEAYTLANRAETRLLLEQNAAADAALAASLSVKINDIPLLLSCLEVLATSVAGLGDRFTAATLIGAVDAVRERDDLPLGDDERKFRSLTMDRLGEADAELDESIARGRQLAIEDALDLARRAVEPLVRAA